MEEDVIIVENALDEFMSSNPDKELTDEMIIVLQKFLKECIKYRGY